MQKLNTDTIRFIELVGSQMLVYLETEAGIQSPSITYHFDHIQRLELYYMTSIMAVEGPLKVIFAFSFDRPLAATLMQAYTAELEVSPEEADEYTEETAADLINIILGNALGHFTVAGKIIELSPPMVITEAKTVYHHKHAQFLRADIKTTQGNMQICCIGPKEFFDQELNYIGK